MALNGRRKIAIAVAGVAGAAALGIGGVALADPGGGGRTELRIVSGHGEDGATTQGSWTGKAPGEDCPERSGADPAQAADGR